MTREVFFLASVYHDAVEAGDPHAEELRAQLDAEIEVEYVERRQIRRMLKPYFVKVGDAYDYDYGDDDLVYDEADAEIENSVRFADACRLFTHVNQMPPWTERTTRVPTIANITNFDTVPKEHYNAEGIAAWLPTSENPFFGTLNKNMQHFVGETLIGMAERIREIGGQKPQHVFVNPETYVLIKKANDCPSDRAYLLNARREADAVLENMHNQIAMDLFRGDDNE